jgi:uncharacterized protein (TIGR02001 family)
MKRLALMAGLSLLFGAGQAGAMETSGNVSIATDYAFRGISQTNENAAIQGGFDLVAESGLYIGIWASNVNFDGSIELDFYGGYKGAFNEIVSYDIGALRYEYPDDEQAGAPLCDSAIDKRCESSFNELYGSLDIGDLTLGLNYSSDYFLGSNKAIYVYADYALELPDDYGLSFHVGSQSIDRNDRFGTPDYNDYGIALSKSVSDLDFSVTWYDTDIARDECFGGTDICEARVVFAISKSL